MKKKLLLIFGITTAITLMSVIVYQTDVIARLTNNVKSEKNRADSAERELVVKNGMVEELSAENRLLKDSIQILHLRIDTLSATIGTLQRTIGKLSKTIQSHEIRVAELTREIKNLEQKGSAYQQKFNQLDKERSDLLLKMEEYDGYRQTVMDQREEAKSKQQDEQRKLEETQAKLKDNQPVRPAEVLPAPPVILNQSPSAEPEQQTTSEPSPAYDKIKNDNQERLVNIKTNTSVKFTDITLRKKETSNDLKKIDSKDWRYTFIEFDLDNPQKELILEETFVLQIFDLDHNQVVPMNESNPEFPESDQGRTGYKFRYKGTPINIRYFNNQRKEGVNYEIRLYYYKAGLYFLLDLGKKLIVENSQVVEK